jgi:hypothetical protein
MKITSILSLAVALCVVSAQAAPSSTTTKTTTSVRKATTTPAKAKTTAKPKTTAGKPKTSAKPKATTTTTTTKAPAKTTAPVPKPKDPCSTLAKEGDGASGFLSYNAVRDCYRAQTYKADVAAKTLTSVENLIGNIYVFLDQAKETSKAPFKTPKVDLMAGLKKIKDTKWKSDYDFNMALTYLTFSANDGHLAYRSTYSLHPYSYMQIFLGRCIFFFFFFFLLCIRYGVIEERKCFDNKERH